jgi:hypothetical protein
MALIDGHLVGHQNPHVCDGRPMAHPFNSATLPMGAPIIYMQGDDDPATTLQNARYHFEGQTGSRRSFVTVRTGAHFPFGLLAECKEAIWDAAAAGGDGLAQALAGCRAETSLEVAP